MFSKKVNISGVNTYKLPVLSSARMKELFQKLQQGDSEARQELINGNLRLVLSVLQRFKNRGENMDDLFQVGCIGLMKAVDNFSLEHNVHFSTYAVPMIVGEIKRYLRDNSTVRVSRFKKCWPKSPACAGRFNAQIIAGAHRTGNCPGAGGDSGGSSFCLSGRQ